MSLLERARRDGKRFLNPIPTEIGGLSIALKVLPQFVTNRAERVPSRRLRFHTDPTEFGDNPSTGLRVTWFGHSGALIEMDGLRVLLDPVWDERASPLPWAGPRRFFPPTMPLASMPPLDLVLITHDHYDHLGKETIRALSRLQCAQTALWVTSLGVAPMLARFGVAPERLREMDWTESIALSSKRSTSRAVLTAYPARHFSGRSPFDRFKSLWSSFVLQGGEHTIYLGGDSGWWPGFPEIAAQHPPFDLTLLEIGAFNELWANIHLGPDGAARAFADMGMPGLLMPVHWGLFDLALHAWRQPITRLTELADSKAIKLWSPRPGLPTDVVRGQELRSDWWRDAGLSAYSSG